MKWPEDLINKVICGDCLEVMKEIPNDCIDTIITDPPYGLEFMGKKWDKFKDTESWGTKELKEQNGTWGGNKKYNPISLLNFKPRMIKTKGELSVYQIWCKSWATEALRVAKPGSTLLCFGGTRTYHRLACAIEDAGWILKDCIMWLYGSGFPKASDISKSIDKMAGKKRKVVGKYELPDVADGKWKKGWECTNTTDVGVFGVSGQQDITAPATPEAALWNGWKSHGLKPAYEPILVAMKPNEGSYANNALKYGVAGLNIDGGRIGTKDNLNGGTYSGNYREIEDSEWQNKDRSNGKGSGFRRGIGQYEQPKGRYPANIILDEEAGQLLDEQSGKNCGAFAPVKKAKRANNVYGEYETFGDNGKTFRGDSGGASRFFYCAKASKAERNRGCEGLEIREAKTTQGLNSPNMRAERGRNPKETNRQNHHPTVKPLSLMKYLCTLTKTPTGGIVLDPFCGSGTTLMACKELKRDYIGIDNNPEYCEIARKRVNAIPKSLF